ncbi:hypothetical protein VNO78_01625 [Psophocarpus tetragonolobus]|uniref:Uncharacterized protein n=1 Tax=Psophocarpus tetragonolobus TaxID=3891 RepID=A0AAN9SY37_PSOTE
MVLGRRPARFQKPDFMVKEPIKQENMQVLRDAASRVYTKAGEKSSEVNVTKEKENESGVHLLATVATELMTVEEQVPTDLKWRWKKKRSAVSARKDLQK